MWNSRAERKKQREVRLAAKNASAEVVLEKARHSSGLESRLKRLVSPMPDRLRSLFGEK